MSLPISRNTTYAPGSQVKSADLNDIQDKIVGCNLGSTGNFNVPGTLTANGTISSGNLIQATGKLTSGGNCEILGNFVGVDLKHSAVHEFVTYAFGGQSVAGDWRGGGGFRYGITLRVAGSVDSFDIPMVTMAGNSVVSWYLEVINNDPTVSLRALLNLAPAPPASPGPIDQIDIPPSGASVVIVNRTLATPRLLGAHEALFVTVVPVTAGVTVDRMTIFKASVTMNRT
jgi:hypothetical protein